MTSEPARSPVAPSLDPAGERARSGPARRHRIERVASTVAFAVASVLLTSSFATGDRSVGTYTVSTIETHPVIPAAAVSALVLVVLLVTQRGTDAAGPRAHARAVRVGAGVFLVVTVLATLYLGVQVQSTLLGWPGSGVNGVTPWWSDAVVGSFEVH